jgi:hypothetical protein
VRLADGVPTGWLEIARFDLWRCTHGRAPASMRVFLTAAQCSGALTIMAHRALVPD